MSDEPTSAREFDEQLMAEFSPTPPNARLLWTAVVRVDQPVDLGQSPNGQRYIVPILGGRFYSGDVDTALAGVVLAGGADRQLFRADGVKELDAIYEMKSNDGVILSIRNRVIVDPSREPERYAMSLVEVTAPEGPLDWLNRRLVIGTLQSARPSRPAVVVRAWLVDA